MLPFCLSTPLAKADSQTNNKYYAQSDSPITDVRQFAVSLCNEVDNHYFLKFFQNDRFNKIICRNQYPNNKIRDYVSKNKKVIRDELIMLISPRTGNPFKLEAIISINFLESDKQYISITKPFQETETAFWLEGREFERWGSNTIQRTNWLYDYQEEISQTLNTHQNQPASKLASCKNAIANRINQIEQNSKVKTVETKTIDITEQYSDYPEKRPLGININLNPSENFKSINSVKPLQVSQSIINQCRQISLVRIGINQTDWFMTYGLFENSQVKPFNCRAPGPQGPAIVWGIDFCISSN